jgi:single-strand DNA-binding protein
MAKSLNKVMLIGNLGRDAETKFTPSGASVTRFSVATTRNWQDKASGEWKEETNWTNVVLWRAEKLSQYLTKGKRVYVEGRLETRSYEDKDGQKRSATEVIADDVILLDGSRGGGPGGGGDSMSDEFGGGGGGYSSQPVSMPRSARGGGSSAGSRGASMPQEDPGFGGASDDDVPF